MNKKEIFEATNNEPVEEEGNTLSAHILDILSPFIEIGQIEWAAETIINACDSALEPYRQDVHSKEFIASMGGKRWNYICGFTKAQWI